MEVKKECEWECWLVEVEECDKGGEIYREGGQPTRIVTHQHGVNVGGGAFGTYLFRRTVF